MDANKIKILLVDDDPDILEIVGYNLSVVGYEVLKADNGWDAIKLTQSRKPHLIILDVMMPELDGIETCNAIRELQGSENIIITFLTARNEDFSLLAGFNAGADDYITKPIKPKVLIKKIESLLRGLKMSTGKPTNSIKRGSLLIDPHEYKVTIAEEEIYFPKKEFELLTLLTTIPGKVYRREEIFDKIWGDESLAKYRTIDVHIRKLRKKLGDEKITTVKGVGYKFEI